MWYKCMRKKKLVYKLILFFFLAAQFQFVTLLNLPVLRIPGTDIALDFNKFSVLKPQTLDSAGISSASATLANPRLSVYGNVNAALSSGATVVTMESSGSYGDLDTANLFPNDLVGIGTNGLLQVASISSSTVFTLKNPIANAVLITDNIYATQSGRLTLDFYTAAPIPAGGSIRVEIPAPAANGNDGAPNTGATIAANGFDLNGITSSNITCPAGLTAAAPSAGTGGNPHVIACNAASTIPAGAHFGLIVGDTNRGLINPAPVTTGHTRGNADIYTIAIYTKDGAAGAGNNIESVEIRTAPVEGVLVTATVDETLSFTVAGVAVGAASTYCGVSHTNAGLTTSATAVPWGIINSSYSVDKNEAVQQLTVTTNAPTGYNVYAEENDQMGKDGAICTGAAPSAGEYTFGTSTCIRDFGSTSSHTTAAEWGAAPGTNYGFGYTLANVAGGGTDAQFTYNTGGTYMAKQFADQEGSENKYAANAHLMANAGPVSGSSVHVCYRIHVPATQPAGYYFNKLKYTAVAKF